MKIIPLAGRSSTSRNFQRAIHKCTRSCYSRGNWVCKWAQPAEVLALISSGARPTSCFDVEWYAKKVKEGDCWSSDFYFVAGKNLKEHLDKYHKEDHDR